MDKKLERNQRNKMLGGVASGLADYLNIDVTLARLAFILLAIFGWGLIIYLILWVVLPEKLSNHLTNTVGVDYSVRQEPPYGIRLPPQKSNDSGKFTAGLILIAIGTYFLMAEFDIIPEWFSITKLWPLAIIVTGLYLMFKSNTKKSSKNTFTSTTDSIQSQADDQTFTTK
jgi:phage shock protein C